MIETMQKRIYEIKQQDRKSYYEIANEIGISESTLYNLMSKSKLFTPAEQKIIAYLKGYLTKDEKLEAYRLDNEEIKAENDRLKELKCKFKEYCTCNTEKYVQCLQEIKEIAEYSIMHNENLNSNYQIILQKITKAEEE